MASGSLLRRNGTVRWRPRRSAEACPSAGLHGGWWATCTSSRCGLRHLRIRRRSGQSPWHVSSTRICPSSLWIERLLDRFFVLEAASRRFQIRNFFLPKWQNGRNQAFSIFFNRMLKFCFWFEPQLKKLKKKPAILKRAPKPVYLSLPEFLKGKKLLEWKNLKSDCKFSSQLRLRCHLYQSY